MSLAWTGIASAEKYEISRKEANGSWVTLQIVKTNCFVDKSCQMGKQYSYRMRAYTNNKWTQYTDTVTIVFNPFKDVSTDAWYYNPVRWAYNRGVAAGTTATSFEPNKTCTRAEFVTFLYKFMGKPWKVSWASECNFTDVKSSDWYYQAVVWAKHAGVTNGTSTTTFSPNQTLDRGMVISFLYNIEKLENGTPKVTLKQSKFTDVSSDRFFYTPVLWAEQYKITNGTSATTFSPAKKCTRAEAVTFLYNINNYWNKK